MTANGAGKEPAEQAMDWLYCTVMGLVEGITEFLPISSTGHLILVGKGVFQRQDPLFEIAIQMGAITAIVFLYRARLIQAFRTVLSESTSAEPADQTPRVNLLWLIVAGSIPAALLGLLLQKQIVAWLFNPTTVGISLIVGGLLLWLLEILESRRSESSPRRCDLSEMSVRQALGIGLFQTLALVPGTSRSGAMIAGGMVVGCRRTSSAEFSFLVGIPVLYGASILKIAGDWNQFTGSARWLELAVAAAVAFVSAWVVVKPFVTFLQTHTFRVFAWYRIVVGTLLLALVRSGVL
jgi:undecaprenyl-diphosphatase